MKTTFYTYLAAKYAAELEAVENAICIFRDDNGAYILLEEGKADNTELEFIEKIPPKAPGCISLN